jgi:hypothetical protein
MGKAKGSVLVGAVKFLRSRRDEALRVLPEQLHHYLGEMISASAWYPEEDLLELIRAIPQLTPGPEAQTLRTMGQVTAREHQEGVYSHLLEGGATPNASFALWSSMHDTGRLEVVREGPRILRVDLSDYANTSREMCSITEAYIVETLRMGGWIARSEKVACRLSGAERCSWRCTSVEEAAP